MERLEVLVRIKDVKADVYMPPMQFRTKYEAIRGFRDLIDNQSSQNLNKHPEDFLLFKVGESNNTTGEIFACDKELYENGADILAERMAGIK